MTNKKALYTSLLRIYQQMENIQDEMLAYKFAVDSLYKANPELPFDWIGIYFYNSVTGQFYLGYNLGQSPKNSMVNYSDLRFPRNQYDASHNVFKTIKSEQSGVVSPETGSEAQVLIKRDSTILGMIVIGSATENAFDKIDSQYLREFCKIVADKVTRR